VIAALAGTVIFFSPLLTHYIESNGFRAAMENETAKGLHFPTGHYAPIRRMGSLTAQSQSFQASDGEKALKSLLLEESPPGSIVGKRAAMEVRRSASIGRR
jgi:hypothetical protein